MIKLNAFWLATAACIVIVSAAPARSAPRDEAEIRALLDRWRKAFHDKDLAGVMSVYQQGPALVAYDLIPPLQYKGWDAYRADYQTFFNQYEGPIDIEDRGVTIIADGMVGYTHRLERISGILKDGKKSTVWTRVTNCYRKIKDRWMVVHEHVSVPADLETGKAVLDLTPD